MTAAAGQRFAGLTVDEARTRGRRRAARGGARSRGRSRTCTTCRTRTARAAHRAADLAPVVLRHGEAGRARDRGGEGRPAALPPGAPAPQVYLELAREHPALVHLAPALVGPPDPGLVPRRRDVRRARARPRATAGSATRTCSTPGSRPRCGRSRRSAGPRRPPSCAPSTPPTCSRRRATSSSSGSRGW